MNMRKKSLSVPMVLGLFLVVASILSLATPAAPPESAPAPAQAAATAAPAGSATAAEPAAKPAATPGFDINALDRATDPCTDFYQFACGSWIKNNPIPPDRGYWGRFGELQERNYAVLREILEKASSPVPERTPVMRQIGDLYASCMDEKTIDSKGMTPLEPELERIAKITSKEGLAAEVARLHLIGMNQSAGRGIGGLLFDFGALPDFKDATSVIAIVDQSGLGLPDRDYYLKKDADSAQTRERYREHVTRSFELLGDAPGKAFAAARSVMDFETALAKVSLDLVSRRDPQKLYNKMTRQEFMALAPSFAWTKYFEGVQAPQFQTLNVTHPKFFKGLEDLLKTASLDDWKNYLRWHATGAASPLLSSAFANQNFSFYGQTLGGAKEDRPRWKRCVEVVDANLGEALGQPYVEATFGAGGKERTLKMVQALEKALEKDVKDLPWMTEATKKQALVKLAAITNKIGYPDKWRDYSGVKIDRGDLVGNVTRARSFELARQLAKIGKPVDKGEWDMSPPTVNAYYDPQMNNINFPAGILQPPFFDNRMDDAVNFGAVGMVIGHELTHGFDDEGRQFDAEGNLKDWWTEKDGKEFEKRAACFVEEYSVFTAVGDVKVNGKLTLGENAADNGGLRIAHMALMDTLGDKPPQPIDGFTAEQRLFLGQAQVWCANVSEQAARLRALTDPHSLPKFRVNGVVVNMPEFRKAFGCKAGSPMVRANPCRVW
jgi:endothelin-converting enzyme/putative endopeptidase